MTMQMTVTFRSGIGAAYAICFSLRNGFKIGKCYLQYIPCRECSCVCWQAWQT